MSESAWTPVFLLSTTGMSPVLLALGTFPADENAGHFGDVDTAMLSHLLLEEGFEIQLALA